MSLNGKKYRSFFWLLTLMLGLGIYFSSCQTEPKKPVIDMTPQPMKTVTIPAFSADNAYQFVKDQVDIGPRYPGSEGQKECADYLKGKLKEYADQAMIQETTAVVPTGEVVPVYNVIGVFNPEAKRRILLSAHWDTRPFADKDDERQDEPILGANDGGSGVGVLLEIARILNENKLQKVGVDIIFWDVEDSGTSEAGSESYCKGSQFWAANPHVPNYKAAFGINLDMVGAKDAIFYQEAYSLNFASSVVRKVWKAAHMSGHGSHFPFESTGGVTDDHVFVNTIAKIPMIDIIQFDSAMENGFGAYWHTHDDNMDVISKKTLGAVGETVARVIYEEDN